MKKRVDIKVEENRKEEREEKERYLKKWDDFRDRREQFYERFIEIKKLKIRNKYIMTVVIR